MNAPQARSFAFTFLVNVIQDANVDMETRMSAAANILAYSCDDDDDSHDGDVGPFGLDPEAEVIKRLNTDQ